MDLLSNDLIWWVTVVDVPALAALFAMIQRVRNKSEDDINHLHNILDRRCDQLRDALQAFKLEVARNYASQRDLRALEGRLVDHLLRIEAKLDRTALKAAAARAKTE